MRQETLDLFKRAAHTFWQAFIIVFFAGMTNVLSAFQANGLSAAKSALLALSLASAMAGLSALKTLVLQARG